jgi:hypothetical protein
VAYTDPNNAVSTQALGRHAAWQWLHGSVPWWNHYSGIGLPLAAEYQAGAFFPLTFLLLLPYGTAWMQLGLQIIAGLGTYGLLRQLGVGRMAATAGGLLYAFNGTLAWFAHAPAAPVPFLPWMLWGVERIYGSVRESAPPAWGMLALSMALVLGRELSRDRVLERIAGVAWTVLRGAQLPRSAWRGLLVRDHRRRPSWASPSPRPRCTRSSSIWARRTSATTMCASRPRRWASWPCRRRSSRPTCSARCSPTS